MLYEASSPKAYLSDLAEDWRKEILLQLRALIMEAAPDLEESIHYKMLGYGVGDRFVFHLNAQKGYVSLYTGDVRTVDPSGALLAGLNVGKGCIRFSKTKPVSETQIGTFIVQTIERWKAGQDTGC